jgi:hypothetical protein
VAEEIETLPDHLYVLMELAPGVAPNGLDRSCTRGADHSRPPPSSPRWRLRELDRDLFQAAVAVAAWSWDARTTRESSIEDEAEHLRRDMSAACDASMPRSVPGTRCRSVYW